MNRSNVRRRVSIPSTTTGKSQTKDFEFVGGIDSNSSNDDVSPDKWVYASDARQIQVGKWQTRKGSSIVNPPAGLAAGTNPVYGVTTGAANFSFNNTIRFAEKISPGTGRAAGFEVNLRNANGATGTIVLALYTDNAGIPGTELFRTTRASSTFTSSYAYTRFYSVTCPDITIGTDYWIVGYVQEGATGSYEVSTTTAATLAKRSIDGGLTWTAQNYSINYRLLLTPSTQSSATKGCIKVTRANGTSYVFMAHGSSLYTVDQISGALTSVGTIDANATKVRFQFVNDQLFYAQSGTAIKPYMYDFTTNSVVSTALDNASAIIEHVGLLFYASSIDTSKIFWTNFGQYTVFTSTDFSYVPAPKTGDPIVGFSKLMGGLYIHTRNNKYLLSGRENATFQLDTAIGQKGTFSQESIAYDEDYIFLASDDGIYRFNGAEERNICVDSKGAGVLDWWTELLSKQNTVLELYNNRLYIFYTPNGESQNSRCKVYNLLYNIWESDDTKCFIGVTHASADPVTGAYFLQGSNRVGMLMEGEFSVNQSNMLGEPLKFELRTAYNHYGSPAQYKRAPLYRPHFDTVDNNYGITVGYALDYSTSPTEQDISLSSTGPRYNTGLTFNSGVRFSDGGHINPMDNAPTIPGEWRRLQLRYSHEAARETVTFDGHVLSLETQRLQ